VERGFVELDDVDPSRLQLLGFFIERLGELTCQLLAALVVRVEERIDHRHRVGQRPFDLLVSLLSKEFGVLDEYRLLARHLTDDGWHTRFIAIANPDGLAFLEVDSAEVLDKGGDEVLARLLAVADNIHAYLPLI